MLRWLFAPISLLYGGVLFLRHKLYDVGVLSSHSPELPTIVVGNLELGGTGKTPHVEYLLRLLHTDDRIATLSRGYGRRSKGFRYVSLDDKAEDSGDEPIQLKRAFPAVEVAVSENRVDGISRLRKEKSPSAIILDDAYQHRKLRPGLSILLMRYKEGGRERLLPIGRLRDLYSRHSSADFLVVSKCPSDLTQSRMQEYSAQFNLAEDRVFFSALHYGEPIPIHGGVVHSPNMSHVILITGLADASPLREYCESKGQVVEHLEFKDHHAYMPTDLRILKEKFDSFDGLRPTILTTSKDAVKLGPLIQSEQMKDLPIYVLPVAHSSVMPEVGIILGTGLGGLGNEIDAVDIFPYEDIPNFPVSTVEGHSGRLILGKLGDKNVVAMQGRFHYYEGYDMKEVTFPVRVMKFLGIKHLFVSNASGGVNPEYEIGDLMILNDHINLFPAHPLRGKNYDELGPRFPDMSKPYDHELIAKAHIIAEKNGIKVQEGCYAGLTGPTLETPAEYRYIYNIGSDAVGMSTVPEVIVARHMGIPCFAISIITDMGVEGQIVEVTAEDVVAVAAKAEPKMTAIMRDLISSI